jgi:hypothetical protein
MSEIEPQFKQAVEAIIREQQKATSIFSKSIDELTIELLKKFMAVL